MFDITADQKAFDKISHCNPQWIGMCQAGEVLNCSHKILLHAGPPFSDVKKIPAPVMNSLCVAAVYEGWADDYSQAAQKINNGEIIAEPAQDHNIVVPLAGVVSPSMMLMVIADGNNSEARKYSVLNEGMSHCTRLGKLDPALQEHLGWLNGDLSEWIIGRIKQPICLLPIIAEALAQGDDCHSRTIAGSALIAKQLLSKSDGEVVPKEIGEFLDSAIAFSLNIWMAASSLMMAAAEGVEQSSVVICVGGNGYEFGLKLAANPDHWITMTAPEVKGSIDPSYQGRKALGAIGDSAVVDFIGLGAQVLHTATASYNGLRDYLPEDALTRPDKALIGVLEGFDGRRGVTSAFQVVANDGGPMVLLGMIEERGELGRIGGGIVDVPVTFFRDALKEADL